MYAGIKPIALLRYSQLAGLVKPQTTTEPEAFKHTLFDVRTYPAAGVESLRFFAGGQEGDTLTNFPASGMLEAGQYFVVERMFLHFLRDPSLTVNATENGALRDVHRIVNTSGGVLSFSMAGKSTRPVPLTMLGSAGGVDVAGLDVEAAPAAGASATVQFAGLARNGGYPVEGGLVLPPGQNFSFDMKFKPGTNIGTDTALQLCLYGTLYRPVV